MKSKQGLIEKWESAIKAAEFYGKGKEDRLIEYMRDFVSDLSQLDEPEVLSQKWIERNTSPVDDEGRLYIWKRDLQNVIMPKQYKPVIPKFVAEWIEKWKSEGLTMSEWFTFDYGDEDENKVAKWLYNNDDETNKYREFMLIDAIRYGYEVEKGKRYYISDEMDNATLMTFDLSDEDGKEIIEFVVGYSENETIHFDSKEKAELIARFVGDSVKVKEVTE